MLFTGNERRFLRSWRSHARGDLAVTLAFMPFDWKASDVVQVNLNTLAINVMDNTLKNDPRPLVQTHAFDAAHTFSTGDILTLAFVQAATPVTANMLLVCKNDTHPRRGRWALKPELASSLPVEMHFLLHGQLCGTF